MSIKVFEKGNFYSESDDKEYSTREIHDGDWGCVIFDRKGRVGIIEHSCYEDFIHWIKDDDDEKYLVIREPAT